MRAFLVFEEVISAMKSAFIAFAGGKSACIGVGFRSVDFSFVALEASFVAKGFLVTGMLVAHVWTGVLVLVPSV